MAFRRAPVISRPIVLFVAAPLHDLDKYIGVKIHDERGREMARVMEVQTAWILNDSRYRNVLLQPHVVGYRDHPVMHAEWLYIDLDPRPGS